ncbi:MAG: DUF2007 domain-containing protein [Gammaproteobacteria bacterium]|nr:DUF2007 domain-containing protein [Gammaproteobacteria bacterium]MCP5445234.1 DUF2007 domain-containing protein [Chromatiaceae bacterium]
MRELYQAKDRIEAQLLKDFLASYHIQTVVHGDYLIGAVGELPVQPFPVLWVLEERDFDRARELVKHFLTQEMADGDWQCTQCGECNEGQFNQCWNCARVRD